MSQNSYREASRRLAVFAPLIFIAHVIEEAPGFVVWVNRLMEPDISMSLFLSVNAVALVITALVALAMASSAEAVGLLALGWFGFLFLANAFVHLVGSAVHGYSPGALTAAFLYLPYSVMLFRHFVPRHVTASAAVAACLVGALPMLVHGYLILFRGSRLF